MAQAKPTIRFYPINWITKPAMRRECDECGRRAWVRAIIVRKEIHEFGSPTETLAASFCEKCATVEVIVKHLKRLRQMEGGD
ncbi:MAG: hypothetical protein N3B10_11020 [Armatimonadetes bacterium]|nr:hypothetical protein [Armatimonadota bacterium]MCX7968998.1 hypothetical protein [Armatimonadota bacterium]MDW8142977.1 hypothetical protein [Armatimonadota bacterium]